ncbi:hypothetical protein GCM10022393_20320 [Aquimarina addita]|uniref:DUF4468 domain-containing protein n=1 Tax=Aquimarina addita TaxID=870485 RepID=A0ABP6UI36_9FLAO
MKKILQITFLLISPILFAQLPQSLLKVAEEVPNFDEYTGSVYQTSNYKDASLIDEKSGTFEAKLKYNIYSDVLEFKNSSGTYEIVQNKTTHARIGEDYFYFCEFNDQRGRDKSGYYVLVELTDNYRIYKKYSINVVNPQKRNTPSGTDTPGKLAAETRYFLEQNNMIMELPMNKKEILIALSDKESELSNYIKKEKIKVRKEEDLIRLVSRYNALKSSSTGPSRSLLSSNGNRN